MNQLFVDRLSPVFAAWHDSGETPHMYSSDTYGKRIVQHYEIEYIVSSRSGYIVTNSVPLQTVPHTVFFRTPLMTVEGIGVYRSLYVELDLNETKERDPFFDSFPSIFWQAGNAPIDISYFASLSLSESPSTADKLLWKAKILQLLGYMLQYLEEERRPVSFDGEERRLEPIKHALSYIQLHFQEPITLQNLADAAGYSSYYFCKLFKKTTQLTPLQYVVRYRLEQAKKLLLTTNDSAETIMLNAGFRNYGYFWRTFKEIYGYSPQAYRNHNR